jgi:hypothetical protein
MQQDKVYEERIFSLLTTVIMTVICSAMLFMFFYQLLVGPVGTRPAPNWFFLFMFLVFLALGLNFASMAFPSAMESSGTIYPGVMQWSVIATNHHLYDMVVGAFASVGSKGSGDWCSMSLAVKG